MNPVITAAAQAVLAALDPDLVPALHPDLSEVIAILTARFGAALEDAALSQYWKGVVRGARFELHGAGRLTDEEYVAVAGDTEALDFIAAIDDAREDKKRLDWLEKEGIDNVHCDALSGPGFFFVDGYETKLGLRAAIDAARERKEQP